jgi:hypothetical protein
MLKSKSVARSICSRHFIGICTAIALMPTPAHGETKLRWKFTAGDKMRFETKTDTTQEIKDDLHHIKMMETCICDVAWEIKHVTNDGTATVSRAVERIRYERSHSDEPPIAFDSQHPQGSTLPVKVANGCHLVIHKPFLAKVTAVGKVLEVYFPDELAAKLHKEVPQNLGTLQFSPSYLKRWIGQSFATLPEQSVAIGHTWEEQDFQRNQTSTTKFTLTGQEDYEGKQVDKIEMVGISQIDLPSELQVVAKQQSTTGKIYWDNACGSLVESNVRTKMNFVFRKDNLSSEQTFMFTVSVKRLGTENDGAGDASRTR